MRMNRLILAAVTAAAMSGAPRSDAASAVPDEELGREIRERVLRPCGLYFYKADMLDFMAEVELVALIGGTMRRTEDGDVVAVPETASDAYTEAYERSRRLVEAMEERYLREAIEMLVLGSEADDIEDQRTVLLYDLLLGRCLREMQESRYRANMEAIRN